MRLTIVQPSVGRRRDEPYLRTWQMESLAPAVLAGLTPPGIDVRFFDDWMERIPYDESTDLVALSVETYTAKRSYQIASEYRRRGVPVVMGGFHPTLVPEESARYAEAIVVGEAEAIWPTLLADFAGGRLRRVYRQPERPPLDCLRLDRSIFTGKRYLPIRLVAAGRGCHLLPFPGTPLYQRIESEGRLRFDRWWLDPAYRFGMVPFVPRGMSAAEIERRCLEARIAFYSLPSIWRRSLDFQVNSGGPSLWSSFFVVNWLMRREVLRRQGFPLGDEAYEGELLPLLPVARSFVHIPYFSRLYLASWDEKGLFDEAVDYRVPYPEIATL